MKFIGNLSGADNFDGSDSEHEVDIASDDEISNLNIAIHVADAENIFVHWFYIAYLILYYRKIK